MELGDHSDIEVGGCLHNAAHAQDFNSDAPDSRTIFLLS
jgi:hypothetical protein